MGVKECIKGSRKNIHIFMIGAGRKHRGGAFAFMFLFPLYWRDVFLAFGAGFYFCDSLGSGGVEIGVTPKGKVERENFYFAYR